MRPDGAGAEDANGSVAGRPAPQDRPEHHLAALEDEVRALRQEVSRLRSEREELLRALAERDYERPPHWQER